MVSHLHKIIQPHNHPRCGAFLSLTSTHPMCHVLCTGLSQFRLLACIRRTIARCPICTKSFKTQSSQAWAHSCHWHLLIPCVVHRLVKVLFAFACVGVHPHKIIQHTAASHCAFLLLTSHGQGRSCLEGFVVLSHGRRVSMSSELRSGGHSGRFGRMLGGVDGPNELT